MISDITKALKQASIKAGIDDPAIKLEHPEDISHGDCSSNVAMIHAKTLKVNPKVLAEKVVEGFNKDLPDTLEPATVAGPGFINFKIKDVYFPKLIVEILSEESFGKNTNDREKKVIIDYTAPNPFKEFHIGHLMNNIIGESISRILENSGSLVKRVTYHGDVGMHIAQSIWGILNNEKTPITMEYLGTMYVFGATKYKDDENAKKEIMEINKKIYDRSDEVVNKVYDDGRKISLDYFEEIYKRLDSDFDNHFYESESGVIGKEIVLAFLDKGVFEKGEKGAVVFRGENHIPKTHTRVFLNSEGLPTYEGKEVGLAEMKLKYFPYDLSITVTANEQNSFFDVTEVAIQQVHPELKDKLLHLSHGVLKLPTGKMSSRTGSIISATTLIDQTKEKVLEKIHDRDFDSVEKEKIAEMVALAAIRYTILRQSIGGDIVFDFDKSLSFEGDSGPYLQYATVRAQAILTKVGGPQKVTKLPEKAELLEKLLIRFPEVIERARSEYAPHHIVTYLTEISSAFNSYYANNQILDDNDPLSPYRVALTKVFVKVMKDGLWVLGIKVPERM